MPEQPPGVVGITDEAISLFEQSQDKLIAEQAQILGLPIRERNALFRRDARLTEMIERVDGEMGSLRKQMSEWSTQRLPNVYAMGANSTGFDRFFKGSNLAFENYGFSWTQPHIEAIEQIAGDSYADVLAATKYVSDDTRRWAQETGRLHAAGQLIEGRTPQQAARDMVRNGAAFKNGKGDPSPITSVQYKDGSTRSLSQYSEMLMRTKTANAFNYGTINASLEAGVGIFEIFDGADCGLTSHDDGNKANGMIVDAKTAAAHPISHPNCRRAFGARPDLDKSALGEILPSTTEDQRADQSAFETFGRALREPRTAREGRTARSGGTSFADQFGSILDNAKTLQGLYDDPTKLFDYLDPDLLDPEKLFNRFVDTEKLKGFLESERLRVFLDAEKLNTLVQNPTQILNYVDDPTQLLDFLAEDLLSNVNKLQNAADTAQDLFAINLVDPDDLLGAMVRATKDVEKAKEIFDSAEKLYKFLQYDHDVVDLVRPTVQQFIGANGRWAADRIDIHELLIGRQQADWVDLPDFDIPERIFDFGGSKVDDLRNLAILEDAADLDAIEIASQLPENLLLQARNLEAEAFALVEDEARFLTRQLATDPLLETKNTILRIAEDDDFNKYARQAKRTNADTKAIYRTTNDPDQFIDAMARSTFDNAELWDDAAEQSLVAQWRQGVLHIEDNDAFDRFLLKTDTSTNDDVRGLFDLPSVADELASVRRLEEFYGAAEADFAAKATADRVAKAALTRRRKLKGDTDLLVQIEADPIVDLDSFIEAQRRLESLRSEFQDQIRLAGDRIADQLPSSTMAPPTRLGNYDFMEQLDAQTIDRLESNGWFKTGAASPDQIAQGYESGSNAFLASLGEEEAVLHWVRQTELIDAARSFGAGKYNGLGRGYTRFSYEDVDIRALLAEGGDQSRYSPELFELFDETLDFDANLWLQSNQQGAFALAKAELDRIDTFIDQIPGLRTTTFEGKKPITQMTQLEYVTEVEKLSDDVYSINLRALNGTVTDADRAILDRLDELVPPSLVGQPESWQTAELYERLIYLNNRGDDVVFAVDDVASFSRINEIEPSDWESFLETKSDGLRLDLTAKTDLNLVEISRIQVATQGEGIGSRVMEELVDAADLQGVTLALTPEKIGSTSKKQLEEFYGRYGFVPNKGKAKDFTTRESFVRAPVLKSIDEGGGGLADDLLFEPLGRFTSDPDLPFSEILDVRVGDELVERTTADMMFGPQVGYSKNGETYSLRKLRSDLTGEPKPTNPQFASGLVPPDREALIEVFKATDRILDQQTPEVRRLYKAAMNRIDDFHVGTWDRPDTQLVQGWWRADAAEMHLQLDTFEPEDYVAWFNATVQQTQVVEANRRIERYLRVIDDYADDEDFLDSIRREFSDEAKSILGYELDGYRLPTIDDLRSDVDIPDIFPIARTPEQIADTFIHELTHVLDSNSEWAAKDAVDVVNILRGPVDRVGTKTAFEAVQDIANGNELFDQLGNAISTAQARTFRYAATQPVEAVAELSTMYLNGSRNSAVGYTAEEWREAFPSLAKWVEDNMFSETGVIRPKVDGFADYGWMSKTDVENRLGDFADDILFDVLQPDDPSIWAGIADDLLDVSGQTQKLIAGSEVLANPLIKELGIDFPVLKEGWQRTVNDSKMRINIRAEDLDSVLDDGRFTTVFERGKERQGAVIDAENLASSRRAVAEENMFGIDRSQIEERPIYGWLDDGDPDTFAKFDEQFGGELYGNVSVIMDDSIRPATTLTVNDSHGAMGMSPINDFIPEVMDSWETVQRDLKIAKKNASFDIEELEERWVKLAEDILERADTSDPDFVSGALYFNETREQIDWQVLETTLTEGTYEEFNEALAGTMKLLEPRRETLQTLGPKIGTSPPDPKWGSIAKEFDEINGLMEAMDTFAARNERSLGNLKSYVEVPANFAPTGSGFPIRDYMELQFHGGSATVNNIKFVEFPSPNQISDPSFRAVLRKLDEQGIGWSVDGVADTRHGYTWTDVFDGDVAAIRDTVQGLADEIAELDFVALADDIEGAQDDIRNVALIRELSTLLDEEDFENARNMAAFIGENVEEFDNVDIQLVMEDVKFLVGDMFGEPTADAVTKSNAKWKLQNGEWFNVEEGRKL